MLGASLRLLSAASNRIPLSAEISTRNCILRLGLFEEGFIKGLLTKVWNGRRVEGLVSAELFDNGS